MEDSRGPAPSIVRRRRALALVILIALVVALAWLLLGDGDEDGSGAANGQTGAAMAVPPGVADLVASLDAEQLAEQVLLVGFEGTDPSAPFLAELREQQLGGVLVDSANWVGAEPGTVLVDALREAGTEAGEIPPLIATAQEGGDYRSLADLPPEETELDIGDLGSEDTADEWAQRTAEGLAAAGFDLNLAPVADVATLDSPIADRAFSDDPAVAAQLTAAAVRGCRAGEVACAVAHFPGLGAASQDTDRGPATVSLDAAGLAARDLQAFQAAFAERVPAVVMSLAFYAAYDPVVPGALSEPVATGLLRDELGFEGVAITDDLGAGAVSSTLNPADAAVEALAAGSDLIQVAEPNQHAKVEAGILAALESGELSEERLRQAAGRVLELKRTLGLLAPN